jgi:hypothetical protein
MIRAEINGTVYEALMSEELAALYSSTSGKARDSNF